MATINIKLNSGSLSIVVDPNGYVAITGDVEVLTDQPPIPPEEYSASLDFSLEANSGLQAATLEDA